MWKISLYLRCHAHSHTLYRERTGRIRC
jgi:hypothetical protein